MIARYTYRGITWVDLESPSPSEVRQVMGEFDIHPLVGEELLSPSFKPKVERFEGHIYAILHFPAFGARLSGLTQEVDFVLGKNFIVTTRYGAMDPFLRFSKLFEANSLLDRSGGAQANPGSVFMYMLKNLYQELEGELESLSIDLHKIEQRIFEGEEREMVSELSRVSRALLTFKQALVPHKGMLESLEPVIVRMYGNDLSLHLKSVLSDYYRVADAMHNERDVLLDLRETNNSLLSTKQNEITKNLTIMAFITFPLTLITGIFGMNTVDTPLADHPYGFWIILVIMLAVSLFFFVYFRNKKWF